MPKRIQRKRTRGWKMPENAVYVGRPTKWGNPWRGNECGSAQAAVNAFRESAEILAEQLPNWLEPLRGYDLACWCPLDQPCHADVLLELANQEASECKSK